MLAMQGYEASTYGDRVAGVYDNLYPDLGNLDTVDRLAELAGTGPVLELAVGTGRIAVPLAERGVQVRGIDASSAMLDRLRAKPGGERVRVQVGDMAEVAVDGRYPLVYVLFNTLFCLLTQDDQVRCFANVAARLEPGGLFVVEAFVPDATRWRNDQAVAAQEVELDRVAIEVSHHHPVSQLIESQTVLLGAEGIRLYPVRLRYAWPSELDLMARLAGLRLRDRWAGWRREPFTSASGQHVSVYERPAGG